MPKRLEQFPLVSDAQSLGHHIGHQGSLRARYGRLAIANSIVFPEDLATTIDALDDEQSEPKVVNVTGNYNDIHDNSSVGMNETKE